MASLLSIPEANSFSRAARFILIFCVLAVTLWLAVILASFVPDRWIQARLSETWPSADYQSYHLFGNKKTMIDHYTECVGATIGISNTTSAIVRSLESHTKGACSGVDWGVKDVDYWRYWHGYQIISRPLLALGGLKKLRALNAIALIGLGLFTLSLLGRRFGMPGLLAAVVVLSTVSLINQLYLYTHSSSWFLGLGLAAYFLWRGPNDQDEAVLPEIFFAQGMLTVFFDFLTTPIVSLTIPMAVLCLSWRQKGIGIQAQMRDIAVCGFAWVAGYIGFWMLKWVLALLIVPSASLSDLVRTIIFRAGSLKELAQKAEYGRLSGLEAILLQAWLGVLFAAVLVGLAFTRPGARGDIWSYLPLASIAIVPCVWALVILNHTAEHYWFVAPILAPSIFIVSFLSLERLLNDRA